MMRRFMLVAATVATLLGDAAAPTAAHEATCSGSIGYEVHGQHVLGLYVVGGSLNYDSWPPTGGVGQYVAGKGAALPGGPGPGFHFPSNIAPGASFCTDSKSPGEHF